MAPPAETVMACSTSCDSAAVLHRLHTSATVLSLQRQGVRVQVRRAEWSGHSRHPHTRTSQHSLPFCEREERKALGQQAVVEGVHAHHVGRPLQTKNW